MRRERGELGRIRRVRAEDRQDGRHPGGGMLAEFRDAQTVIRGAVRLVPICSAGRPDRCSNQRPAALDLRFGQQDRVDLQLLSAGRMENNSLADPQFRRALRPIRRACQRATAEPAREFSVAAERVDRVSRGLFALFSCRLPSSSSHHRRSRFFANTTAAPAVTLDTTSKAERANYFDCSRPLPTKIRPGLRYAGSPGDPRRSGERGGRDRSPLWTSRRTV